MHLCRRVGGLVEVSETAVEEIMYSLTLDGGCDVFSRVWEILMPYSTAAIVVSENKSGLASINQHVLLI